MCRTRGRACVIDCDLCKVRVRVRLYRIIGWALRIAVMYTASSRTTPALSWVHLEDTDIYMSRNGPLLDTPNSYAHCNVTAVVTVVSCNL